MMYSLFCLPVLGSVVLKCSDHKQLTYFFIETHWEYHWNISIDCNFGLKQYVFLIPAVHLVGVFCLLGVFLTQYKPE